jgi:16S rRNA C967 or C1407 C5-methylase (RsmB/RsmF family)
MTKNRGTEAFNQHFEGIYGLRWPGLSEALQKPVRYFDLVSPSNGEVYHLDEASVIAARSLPRGNGTRTLDMCAAPGGKALTMLFDADASESFVLNERSATRRGRLARVLSEFVGEPHPCPIKVTGHDATKWGLYEKDAYDAILLDAPCSSERHLLEKPELLKEWSQSRTKTLAIQQFAMLAAACAAIKQEGHILYATCSISPHENDEVIDKLLKKREGFEIVPLRLDKGEPTRHGWIFLPDACQLGPLYMCLIKRF